MHKEQPVKILIVDDEPTITKYFSQLAEIRGFEEIDSVGSGEDAMTQVIRKNYDIITLDIQMPGASGLEIIAMLRNMFPHAIIAVISGFIPEEISSDVAGCVDVMIPKPVNVETFNKLLANAEIIHNAMSQIRNLGVAPSTVR